MLILGVMVLIEKGDGDGDDTCVCDGDTTELVNTVELVNESSLTEELFVVSGQSKIIIIIIIIILNNNDCLKFYSYLFIIIITIPCVITIDIAGA